MLLYVIGDRGFDFSTNLAGPHFLHSLSSHTLSVFPFSYLPSPFPYLSDIQLGSLDSAVSLSRPPMNFYIPFRLGNPG